MSPGRREKAGGSITEGAEVGRPRRGGARPPVAEVIAVLGEHLEEYGVEPMCRVLHIAPSTRHVHAARRAGPDLRPQRVKQDEKLCAAILPVHAATFGVHGARPRRPSGRRCFAVGSRGLLARDGPAPAPARGLRHRPRPGGAVDAPAGSRRRPQRKARENDAQRQDGLCPLDEVNRHLSTAVRRPASWAAGGPATGCAGDGIPGMSGTPSRSAFPGGSVWALA